MNFLYNLGIRTYVTGIRTALLCGNQKAMQMEMGRDKWAETLHEKVVTLREQSQLPTPDAPLKLIWFHAASLGEFEQGRPLIEQLREKYPQYKILVTFFSPSGYEVRKNYKGADIICYLPYDLTKNVRIFLDIVQPELVFFVKYEFWGNILEELHRRQIPTYLISGIFRKEQIFFKWYGWMFRPILKYFNHLFVQDEESKRLLNSLNIKNVTITGDTRFDRVIAIQQQAKEYDWAAAFRLSPPNSQLSTLVAGSSWPKDEDIILSHFNEHPEMKLIIAPHEIHEEHIQSIISKLKRKYIRYTQLDKENPAAAISQVKEVDCIIIDAIGFLSSIYRYGDIAYIGGGFGVGIHNTLEAAVYGIPVIFGPNHTHFREALGLLECGGGFTINDKDDYASVINKLMTVPSMLKSAGNNAESYVRNNSGASDAIFSAVLNNK